MSLSERDNFHENRTTRGNWLNAYRLSVTQRRIRYRRGTRGESWKGTKHGTSGPIVFQYANSPAHDECQFDFDRRATRSGRDAELDTLQIRHESESPWQ
ncbi:hypothetical protein EVAR_88734_1 [Eumeta japonica]|uniref:Uncharacterized protein n=1 Tax=Eumeta variegata TaxID=151549 RepID=A0A4C1XFE0_EUMVA|nr:hypothetical protein EVAR_88734_1 [Eumeta japonica]